MKIRVVAAALAIAPAISTQATAADQGHGNHQEAMEHVQPYKLSGVVNNVNPDARRINITHDGLESLKWPKMKINFKAHDSALLEGLKPGMRVDFEIEKMGDEYYVTKIVPAR